MMRRNAVRHLRLAALLLAMPAAAAAAQQAPVTTPAPQNAAQTAPAMKTAEPANRPTHNDNEEGISSRDRRHAAKLFLEATKLFEKAEFGQAMQDYEQAAELDPGNADYAIAGRVTRSHVVTELIQTAAKARLRGDEPAARAALQRALELDPRNAQVAEHLQELAGSVVVGQSAPIYEQASSELAEPPSLAPAPEVHSFHLRADMRQIIQTVFRAYGIEATVDTSVPAKQARLDLDNVKFEQAARILNLVTDSFWVTLDTHRVLVAKDTRENRQQFVREEMETVYLSGLTTEEMTDVGNLAKNVFQAQRAIVSPTAGTLTLRAPPGTLDAFNTTLRQLLDGRSQVQLEVRMIQLAHTHHQNTGAGLPQQITAFNVYAEEQAILNANQSLVQQIISSGLAAPGDNLAILGILLASGQVSSSLFSNGIALFGGGLTLSGLSPGPTTLNLSLNSSDSRELDQIQLRLGDGEEGTLRSGMRYPITTSSYSGLSSNAINIPGLTSAGSSSNLSSLLSSLAGAAAEIPQVEYQDLGLTLKATPKVMRGGDVALTVDLKITALAGPSLNGVPVLNNRNYSGVVTLKEGSAVVVASELDEQESRALSGVPGISEIPGMNNLTGKEAQKDYATLLVIISPHVIRGTQAAGRSPMMRIEQHMGVE
jgi:general secretion pathway protein D